MDSKNEKYPGEFKSEKHNLDLQRAVKTFNENNSLLKWVDANKLNRLDFFESDKSLKNFNLFDL